LPYLVKRLRNRPFSQLYLARDYLDVKSNVRARGTFSVSNKTPGILIVIDCAVFPRRGGREFHGRGDNMACVKSAHPDLLIERVFRVNGVKIKGPYT
jgi:hypothetical protein